jgi:hypothetical protein
VNHSRLTAVATAYGARTFTPGSTNSNVDGQGVARIYLEGLSKNYATGSTTTRACSDAAATSAATSAATDNE